MKAYYIGNFGAPGSTENAVADALVALGWRVDRHDERAFMAEMAEGFSRRVERRALGSRLVLHTMTQGAYPNRANVIRLWELCARHAIPTVSLHLDLFYGLASPKQRGPQRYALPAEHPMFRVAHVFTPDGGHDELWARDGVNHHWLPPGVRHDEALDVGVIDSGPVELPMDVFGRLLQGHYLVGFAGNDRYHAEWPHRRQLIDHLRHWYGDRFLHIGGSATPRITGLALNRVFAAVPVWVGDSCLTRPDFPYWSDRVPECWGRGGFLIHPEVDALNEHYYSALQHAECLPGTNWTCGDWRALRFTIEQWLANPDEREELRSRLAAYTRRFDTYVQRVQMILRTVGIEEAVAHE